MCSFKINFETSVLEVYIRIWRSFHIRNLKICLILTVSGIRKSGFLDLSSEIKTVAFMFGAVT
jgi:hypothetical protein